MINALQKIKTLAQVKKLMDGIYRATSSKNPLRYESCWDSLDQEINIEMERLEKIMPPSQDGINQVCMSLMDFLRLKDEKFVEGYIQVSTQLREFLSEKNKRYGDSALHPLNIFAKGGGTNLEARMDDKLARIKNSPVLRKNDIADLMGYLVLLCIREGFTSFEDLID